MAIIPSVILFLVLIGIMIQVINSLSNKGVSGLKIMLLGISITLFGGIFVLDRNFNIGGIKYIIVLLGFIISIVGFGKKD